MKKLDLCLGVGFEVTRRCNSKKCKDLCMRGKAQNINMSRKYVDDFFDTQSKGYEFRYIDSICFTGGEPTLNPDVIIYTIDKIIEEDKSVYLVSMTTNGQIFVPEIVEAFNRYNEFYNLKMIKRLQKEYKDNEEILKKMIIDNTNNHARITFSTDRFHPLISEKIRELYNKTAKNILITDYSVRDEDIKKIGFATSGKEFKNGKTIYSEDNTDLRSFYQMVYLTAKGYVMFGGDGSYKYIDSNLLGKAKKVSLYDSIEIYGEEIFKRTLK